MSRFPPSPPLPSPSSSSSASSASTPSPLPGTVLVPTLLTRPLYSQLVLQRFYAPKPFDKAGWTVGALGPEDERRRSVGMKIVRWLSPPLFSDWTLYLVRMHGCGGTDPRRPGRTPSPSSPGLRLRNALQADTPPPAPVLGRPRRRPRRSRHLHARVRHVPRCAARRGVVRGRGGGVGGVEGEGEGREEGVGEGARGGPVRRSGLSLSWAASLSLLPALSTHRVRVLTPPRHWAPRSQPDALLRPARRRSHPARALLRVPSPPAARPGPGRPVARGGARARGPRGLDGAR